MNKKEIPFGVKLFLAIMFTAVGSIVAMLISKGFEMSKSTKAIVAFVTTSSLVLGLFPSIFRIPFDKLNIAQWLYRIGLYKPLNLSKHIILGIILGIVSLSGMLMGSIATGKYAFDISNVTVGHLLFSLTPGIWEEIMFRGVVTLLLISRYKNIKKAFWIQTLIFAFCHFTGPEPEAIVEVISVFIIGITFSLAALKTRTLIAGMVYHYIHDAFLYLVQNPGGEYHGFADNATFYSFLWAAMLINIMIIVLFTGKLKLIGENSFYEIEGIKNNMGNFNFQPAAIEKAEKIERISYLVVIFGFISPILSAIEDGNYFILSLLGIVSAFSLLLFIRSNKMSLLLSYTGLILNSFGCWVSGYLLFIQGSHHVYIIYYLLGVIYLLVTAFKYIMDKENNTGATITL